jgi:NADH-quinone oxidoreductase subunit N
VNAPVLWIIVPILVGSVALLLLNERAVARTGGVTCLLLASLAAFVPFDQALRLGPLSFKISSSADFLGRSIALPPAEGPLLAMIFAVCALWFFGAEGAGVSSRLIPLGLYITALLIASIAVQPFLYAALLIELAVLVAVPLLSPPGSSPGKGLIRFLIYQTLGMPFILLSGWLLAGVESSPGDISLTLESTVMLALGFAFLLAIFPLNDWVPRIMVECHPYVAGFVVWLLPNFIVVFAMSFLDRYAWLRTSSALIVGLRSAGLLMLVAGGLWAAFERHLGRILAYAATAETGLMLIAMSLTAGGAPDLVFLFLIPRGIAFTIWALSLSILKADGAALSLPQAEGLARAYPWSTAALVAAALSTAGFPLLAGFPPRLSLWAALANESVPAAMWYFVGLLALVVAAGRQFAAMYLRAGAPATPAKETLIERGMLGIGVGVLLLLGLFPESVGFIVRGLPLMFEHLGR